MLLLALLMCADLSLFTADPATVEDYAKKLDEGVPWVDEFGQPVAGEWEGKVDSQVDLIPGDFEPLDDKPIRFLSWTPEDERPGFYLLTKKIEPVSDDAPFTTETEGEVFEFEPFLLLGVMGLKPPHTPIDGRRFVFANLPDARSEATRVNPYERASDLGTVYVSHVVRNLNRRYGPNWPSAWQSERTRQLSAAGFYRESAREFVPLALQKITNGFSADLDNFVKAADLAEPAASRLIQASSLPSLDDTRAILAGIESPEKLALLELLAPRYENAQALCDALGVKSLRELRRARIDLAKDDLAVVHEGHLLVTRTRLTEAIRRVSDRRRLPLFSDAPGFDGMIHHGDTVPDDVEGPVIQVITLPMAAPGFAGMSEDEAVKRWRTAVRAAREDDRIVAVLWGRFWDDPVTGIGPKTDDVRLVQGRAEAAGLWDVTGRPKLSLLKRLNAETDPTDPKVADERE